MTENIFINAAGRLRSGWRCTVFVALFVVLSLFIGGLTKSVLSIFVDLENGLTNVMFSFVLQSLLLILPALLVSWICLKFIESLPIAALGLNFHNGWWRDVFYGLGFGIATLLLAILIAAVCGSLQFTTNQNAGARSITQTLLTSMVVFVLGALGEEILFREYPLQTFARAHVSWIAILLTSVFFSILHLGNPNVVPYFTFINTILAGIWFALAYLKTRSLWFPLSLHFSWNWVMAAILGLPVSGITEITPNPVLQYVDNGPAWLSGGNYGIEGGVACTIAIIISTGVVWFAPFLKPTSEMFLLTSNENPSNNSLLNSPPGPPTFNL